MTMLMRTNLEMGSFSFNTQSNHGIMGDHHGHGSSNNFPYSDDISSSESSDLMENGSLSSGSSSPGSPAAKVENGAFGDMSSLLQQLPIKRGLSKYFNGKSQSYNSLSNVTCLEDLAKPENPYTKKLKSCKSYMCFSEATSSSSSSSSKSPPRLKSASSNSKLISKKSSRRNGGGGSFTKPPTHPTPHRSSSTSSFNNGTPMFA